MPEGPEIRRAADRIAAVIQGREATEVFFAFERLRHAADELRGRTVTKVATHGKAMLTWFDDTIAVYSHNQLYGRWFVRRRPGLPETGRQLRFAVHTEAGSALLYSASEIAVLDRDALGEHPFLAKLGPDPLHETTTARVIRQRLGSDGFRRRRLASLLLDQSAIAGLGNYLRSEILFDAGLHPRLRPADLDADALAALARSVNRITRRAYRTGGITQDQKGVAKAKRRGETRRTYRHYVFARSGQSCRRCGAVIEKVEMAGRRLYLCPRCQQG